MFSGALSLKPHGVTDSECLASRNPACLALDVSWWQGRRVRGFAPPSRPCAARGGGACGRPLLPPPRGGAGSLGVRTRVELPFPAAAPPDPTRPGPTRPGAALGSRGLSRSDSGASPRARRLLRGPPPRTYGPGRPPDSRPEPGSGIGVDRLPTRGSLGPGGPARPWRPFLETQANWSLGRCGPLVLGRAGLPVSASEAQASEEGMEGREPGASLRFLTT